MAKTTIILKIEFAKKMLCGKNKTIGNILASKFLSLMGYTIPEQAFFIHNPDVSAKEAKAARLARYAELRWMPDASPRALAGGD